MDSLCAQCGAHLESLWSFCPQCGANIAPPPTAHAEPAQHEPAPVTGAYSGLFLGLIALPVLLIVGTMLCLTGLGAILGVPMIIAGVLAPLAGPLFGMGTPKNQAVAPDSQHSAPRGV